MAFPCYSPILLLPFVIGMSLNQVEQRKQLMTALPLLRQPVKVIENYFLLYFLRKGQ